MRGWFVGSTLIAPRDAPVAPVGAAVVVALGVIAGCYEPGFRTGAPCVTDLDCPSRQACVARTCGGGAPPAADDADADGRPDLADNCPATANPDQANEDGDRFGDACDPCPVVADDAPQDPDGDGVAGACDPNPTIGGDRLELFDGFAAGLANWLGLGDWTAAQGALATNTPANEDGGLFRALASQGSFRMTMSLVVDQVNGGDVDHLVGFGLPHDPIGLTGAACDLAQQGAEPAARQVLLWDLGRELDLAGPPFAWATGTTYTLVATIRNATSYACHVELAPTRSEPAAGTSSAPLGPTPYVWLHATGIAARIHWVLVVRTP